MIDHRANEIVIVDGLKAYLSTATRPCEVVRQNQVAEAPPYPYVSYTVTTPLSADRGSYCESEDGRLYRDTLQTWSFTVQSSDQDEAMSLGMKMFDYFTAVGVVPLADKNITIRRVTNLTTRDNMISIQYEYRNGLDVTFGLLYEISSEQQPFSDEIDSIEI